MKTKYTNRALLDNDFEASFDSRLRTTVDGDPFGTEYGKAKGSGFDALGDLLSGRESNQLLDDDPRKEGRYLERLISSIEKDWTDAITNLN